MTRRDRIYALKQQKKELLDRKAWLEQQSSEYGEEYNQLNDEFIGYEEQTENLREFTDFCETVPIHFLDSAIRDVSLAFASSFGFSLGAGVPLFVPFIAGPVAGSSVSMGMTLYNYYSLKAKAMCDDLSDFEMERYDIIERKKGVFRAREIMDQEARECEYKARYMNSEIDSAVKGKVR